jgi:hypothetical protein
MLAGLVHPHRLQQGGDQDPYIRQILKLRVQLVHISSRLKAELIFAVPGGYDRDRVVSAMVAALERVHHQLGGVHEHEGDGGNGSSHAGPPHRAAAPVVVKETAAGHRPGKEPATPPTKTKTQGH